MAPPTKAALQMDLAIARRQIAAALALHVPVPSAYRVTAREAITCRLCRDPWPCDTAQALGAR